MFGYQRKCDSKLVTTEKCDGNLVQIGLYISRQVVGTVVVTQSRTRPRNKKKEYKKKYTNGTNLLKANNKMISLNLRHNQAKWGNNSNSKSTTSSYKYPYISST